MSGYKRCLHKRQTEKVKKEIDFGEIFVGQVEKIMQQIVTNTESELRIKSYSGYAPKAVLTAASY